MIVNICHCKDLYAENMDISLLKELCDTHDITSRKLCILSKAWTDLKENNKDQDNK